MNTYTYSQVFEESLKYFDGDEFAAKVFVDKYALQNNNGEFLELTPTDMHHRLAKEFARIESKYPNPLSEDEIFDLLDHYKYIIPQGSPMFGIGNNYFTQSLGNCFVIESPYDSYGGILKSDQELAQLMKRRAGVGLDISNIRPKGLTTNNAAKTTDGIAIFMERFSNTCREVAQCLGGDTLILTIDGLKKISDIKIGDEVWTNQKWVSVEKILKNKKKVVKLTTKFGRELIASKDHILHSISGEKRIEDFKVGDQITQIIGEGWQGKEVLLNNLEYEKIGLNKSNRLHKNINLSKVIDKDLAYLLGQMYGDGNVEGDDNGICVALSDDWQEITDKYFFLTKKIFNIAPSIKNKLGEKCSRARFSSKEIVHHLKINNLLKQKSDKIIFPDKLLQAKKEVIFSFISGYFDADGCVQESKKQYKFSSIQKEFLLTIQSILLSFGVISKLHEEIRNHKPSQEKWKNIYSLTINGFSQKIFKCLMIESIKVSKSLDFDKKADWTRSNYNILDLGSKSNDHKSVMNNEQQLSYSLLLKMKEKLNNTKNTFLFEDHVKSIEEQSEEVDVYDLVLPKEHLFFANGLYAHNSGRRGALIETISINHPEIETFINIKKDLKKVTGANISIRLTDEFMNCVKNNSNFTLRFPVDKSPEEAIVTKKVKAKDIWNQIIDNAWSSAEPGILFWDTIINNSPADIYAEKYPNFKTQATNPCGELPLGLDSCRLLIVNLLSFVKNPFSKKAEFDYKKYSQVVQKAQRLMDDLVDLEIEKITKILNKIKSDPEPDNVKQVEINLWTQYLQSCEMGRRTGTGITGLGDCLAALNIKYGSKKSIEVTEEIYKQLMIHAYKSSCIMAGERGSFPIFDHVLEKNHPFITQAINQDDELKELYINNGRRNVALLTTAPAGSVSTQTQTTSGIEPAFMLSYVRRKKHNPSDVNAKVDFVDAMGDKWQEFTIYHQGLKKWMDATGELDINKSPYFEATSNEIDWLASVEIQAAAQKSIDHSISKTCNLPKSATKELVSQVYMKAWESGCKGFTIYREGSRDGVLISESDKKSDRPENIEYFMAPKRSKELNADIKKVKVSGEAWTIFVGLLNEKPYEIFGGLSKYIDIPNKNKIGRILKNGKNSENISTYDLVVGDNDDALIIKDLASVFENKTHEAFTRLISLNLRHGTPIQYIVEQLTKDKYAEMTSFSKVISRVLKTYIKDGAKSTEKICNSCKSVDTIVYQEGCSICTNCKASKCG